MKSSKFATALRTCIATLLLTFVSGAWAEPLMQAIWCSGNSTLYFTYAEPVTEGTSYQGQTATKVYSEHRYNIYREEWNNDFEYAYWTNNADIYNRCTKVVFEPSFADARPTTCLNWFMGFIFLTDVQGIAYLNTSEVTSMRGMFCNCQKLTGIDLTNFDTSNVTDMEDMFKQCLIIESLNLSSFNTSKVTSMVQMFYGCKALKTLTIGSGWDTSNVEDSSLDSSGMFYDIPKNTILPLCLYNNKKNDGQIDNNKDKTTNIVLQGRTLYKDGEWNTICLPFNVTIAGSPLDGAILKELVAEQSSFSDGKLTLKFQTATAIEAGKPYIIKWNKAADYTDDDAHNIVNPVFNGAVISTEARDLTGVDFNGGSFVGQYDPFQISSDNINSIVLLSSGNRLGYSTAERKLRSMRAHFVIPATSSNAPAMTSFAIAFDDEEETTDIINPQHSTLSSQQYYTLDGLRVNSSILSKGIYIINGKKIMMP